MDEKWDLIIIGAGTAGIPAAIFGSQRSNRILTIDSAPEIGGTLHLSSGQMSAAGTKLQKSKGIDDSPALHLEDIMRISKNTANSKLAGLAVENAAETLDWLETLGFKPLPGHPVKGQAHEPYSVNRYIWGEELGKSILQAIRVPFEDACKNGKVTLRINSRVSKINKNTDGNSYNLEVTNPDGSKNDFSSKNVLISAGGYVSNGEMYKKLSGHPAYGDHSYPYCVGDGLNLGLDLGGVSWGHENYLTSFGVIMEDYNIPSKVRFRPIHWPERRQPWEIYVNSLGKRFIREDEPSVDVREHSIQNQPDLRHWIVFDSEVLEKAPSLFGDNKRSSNTLSDNQKDNMDPDGIKQAAENSEPMFYLANDIKGLAEKAGIDVKNLIETIEKYNIGQKQNLDEFGRKHMPLPINNPPFYAIRSQAMSVSSTVGLKVDSSLRLVREDNSPIDGIYAAGESIGQGALMGSSFCGGMLVTPALTFGRLLGQKILPLD